LRFLADLRQPHFGISSLVSRASFVSHHGLTVAPT
jgi:hypothetical protein